MRAIKEWDRLPPEVVVAPALGFQIKVGPVWIDWKILNLGSRVDYKTTKVPFNSIFLWPMLEDRKCFHLRLLCLCYSQKNYEMPILSICNIHLFSFSFFIC